MSKYTHIIYIVVAEPSPHMECGRTPFGRIYGADRVGGWCYSNLVYRGNLRHRGQAEEQFVHPVDGPSACQMMIPGTYEEAVS